MYVYEVACGAQCDWANLSKAIVDCLLRRARNLVKPEAKKYHRRSIPEDARESIAAVRRFFAKRFYSRFYSVFVICLLCLLIWQKQKGKREKERERDEKEEAETETRTVKIFSLAQKFITSGYRIRSSVSTGKHQYRKVPPFPVNHFNYFQAGSPSYLISIFRISRFTWIHLLCTTTTTTRSAYTVPVQFHDLSTPDP